MFNCSDIIFNHSLLTYLKFKNKTKLHIVTAIIINELINGNTREANIPYLNNLENYDKEAKI